VNWSRRAKRHAVSLVLWVERELRRLGHIRLSAQAMSALAAALCLLTALTALQVQEGTALNAVRPELIVEWNKDAAQPGGNWNEYRIAAIENVGQGPAF
jgi:hypothetical protein